jgi:LysR family transcriptional regulator, regulator of abg operon
MRLTQIRDFLAVVEAGSIRSAARKLGVSQPAITKSVKSLEAELQVQLLQRTPHGIALTRSGTAFFNRVRVASSELDKAIEEATQPDGEGLVAFGVGPVAAVLVAPTAISRFRRQFPRARVRVVEGFTPALLPLVRNETLDFGMGPKPTQLDPAFSFRPLYRTEHVVAARKGHALGKARSLAELIDAEWLDSMHIGQVDVPFERMFGAAGLRVPERLVHCESYSTRIAMVAKTSMLTVLPKLLLAEPSTHSVLQEIPVAEPLPVLNVGMFARADVPLTPTAAAMAKVVTAVARELARR